MYYLYESRIISVLFVIALIGLTALTKITQNKGISLKSADSFAWSALHIILIDLKGFFLIGLALSAFAYVYWMN
ncbi:hypothetical protein [Erwinia amylovora]|uniref:hypothetical protein n=1 Tax=Erwinia amylovora TaxID=552 RepID=UPI001444838F|nr:hypothetical protein [Erwinia amylovora]